jgi:hypothetical protein
MIENFSHTFWVPAHPKTQNRTAFQSVYQIMPFISDIEVSSEKLESLCKRYEVKELSLFGSRARGEHRPDSDVDLLVEFLPGASIGLIGYSKMQRELQTIFGIKVDLVTKIGLKPIVRKFLLLDIKPLYASA